MELKFLIVLILLFFIECLEQEEITLPTMPRSHVGSYSVDIQ